jgi:hypothetical protein
MLTKIIYIVGGLFLTIAIAAAVGLGISTECESQRDPKAIGLSAKRL